MDMDAANSNEDDENSPLMVDEECNRKSSWHPRFEAFSPYSPPGSTSTATSTKSSALRIVARRSLVARLTKDIVDTYRACNPKFSYSEVSKPKRFLTSPSNGVLNDGHDNANSDLILSVNFVLVNESQQRYIVKDMLGQGTFGQVAKCWISETNSYVAVKVIKNQPAYYHQALVEVSILTMLNQRFDPEDKHHIVRILDYFVFQQHLCISFEMLGSNLYELIKMNQFRGLSLSIVQMFSKQILHALIIMKDAGIIHCDLKPENILLSTNVKPPEIKVIDFGSACTENRTVYSYIQSRYYRSPEVLLGHPYTTAIDMWSFGCIIAELFLGLPLFPGASEFDLMKRMIEILGAQPPDYMLKASKSTSKFFKCVGGLHCVEDEDIDRTKTPYQLLTESPYQLLTEEEYEVRELKKPVIGKQYFNYVRLEDIVVNYPYRKNLTKEEINKESLTRLALIDFLRGVIEFDPVKRWSPSQAAGHPFLTGEPYLCPYVPPSETPRISVAQNVIVDHNPGGGHWFQAGLSPQISDGNRYLIHNGLYFPVAPFSLASSYGSYGSHGSYKDCNLGSSHGSYGDGMYNNLCSIGPPGLNILQTHIGSGFGANQATKHRASQIPHGPTYGGSSVGKFGAMSLGASPSQFTPPTSQLQISSGSPGKYGPTSPARNNLHGSPLSKVSAVGHYNQRRSWGYSNASHMQPHENMSFQNRHGSYTDGSGFNHPENNSFGHGSPHNFQLASSVPGWMQGCGNYAPGLSSSLTIHQNYSGAAPLASHLPASSTTEAFLENIEYTSQPNPGDWDPNYSDDLLLQDDDPGTAALSSGIFNGLHLSKASDSTIVTANAADRRIFNASNQIQRFCGNNSSNRRTNTFQTYCHGEGNSSPINDKHNARNILKHPHHMPHYLQSSPSRFSQQPFQQMYYTQGALATSDCDQTNKLPFASYCNTQGHRTNHHPTSSLPPPHSRKDYERIA